jgi:hypothetical protein
LKDKMVAVHLGVHISTPPPKKMHRIYSQVRNLQMMREKICKELSVMYIYIIYIYYIYIYTHTSIYVCCV